MAYGPRRPTLSELSIVVQGWGSNLWMWTLSLFGIVNKTAAYTVADDVFHVRADATSAGFTVTIPASLNTDGRQIVVTKVDSSSNAVTVGRTGSDTFNGATSISLATQWDSVRLIANGNASWDIIGRVDADTTALMAISGTGMVARTATTPTYATRTVTGTANQITVSQGDGVAGNPTLSLAVGDVVSGTYTPTLTNVANLDGSTAYQSQYMRVGATVTVSGRVDMNPTAAATLTQLRMTVPVASNFGGAEDCSGVIANYAGVVGQIRADTTNDAALAQLTNVTTANDEFYFTFTYQVI